MKSDVIALVDCNNFYVSCERVFNPKLEKKPVVVLSNNDGVIIARSNEVKALGIKMATPIFKVQNIVDAHNIEVFSSNYVLYGDMSARVMSVLIQYAQDIEIYSIDEAFLSFNGMQIDENLYIKNIRNQVQKWTGIPISIGVGSTKTLAKVANETAKKNPKYNGTLSFTDLPEKEIDEYLQKFPVDDVWGVGRKTAPVLRIHGIRTARDLKYASDSWIRKMFSVVMLRTVHELRGINCVDMEMVPAPQKSIASTRSFGRPVSSISELKESVAMYCSVAAEKLRKSNQLASVIQIFILTNYHKKTDPQYANAMTQLLPFPTSDTLIMVKTAHEMLTEIYKEGYKYKKAGIILLNLMSADAVQLDLFRSYSAKEKGGKLMKTMDAINKKWGRGTLQLATIGIRKPWTMKQEKISKRYTTSWDELIVAKTII